MFKEYIAYLKDNPKKLWFKRKLYGFGWVPVRWEGWLTILIFVTLLICNAFRMKTGSLSITSFILETIVFVVLLIYICIRKGEKTRWQWGKNKE